MIIEQLKKEIYYYTGIKLTDKEAWEIYDMMQENSYADSSAIVADYYGC